jgi:integrase
MWTVILLMCSSGMRIGAIPELRLRNLEKVQVAEFTIYKITVYENDKEEHFTFCTPECAKAIDQYLEIRKRYDEKLNQNSILIREQFDKRDSFAISRPVKMASITLENKIIDLGVHCGIRKKETVGNEKHRRGAFKKEAAACHGFRKFFTTQLINTKINPEIREMLLGHTIGLVSCYYKPSSDDFVIEYQKEINNLTINEEYRLKMKVQKLEIEKSKLEELAQDVAILKRKW